MQVTIKLYSVILILVFVIYGSAFQCDSHCLICTTPTTCSQCDVQYFMAPIANCLKCPLGCLQCVSSLKCQNCLPKTEILLNLTGYTFNNLLEKLLSIIQIWIIWITYPGYTLVNNAQCKACVQYCLSCSSSTSCDTCLNGFYFQNNSCVPCSPFCLTCNSSQTCTECAVGYGFNQTSNLCQYCHFSYCLSCSINQNSTECLNCAEDTFINGPICSPCPTGCLQCKDMTGKCIQCLQFFYPDQVSGQCVRCQPNQCQSCVNSTYCTKCAVGYLNQINNETITCSPCEQYCISCTSQNDCKICQIGYYVSLQLTCQQCSSMCLQCSSATTCSECMIGTYLTTQNTCTECPQQCAVCTSPNKCGQCISQNYYFNGSFCVLCQQAIPNCLACYGNKCIQCEIGYQVIGYTCQDSTTSIAAIWIVLIITSTIVILGGIGFGIYSWWRRRQGFMGPLSGQQSGGLRASYYQVP